MGVRPRTTLLLFFYFKISSSYGMSGRCKNNVQGGLRVLCSVSPTGNVLHYHGTVLKPGNWHWYNPHSLLISRFLTLKSDFVSLNSFFFLRSWQITLWWKSWCQSLLWIWRHYLLLLKTSFKMRCLFSNACFTSPRLYISHHSVLPKREKRVRIWWKWWVYKIQHSGEWQIQTAQSSKRHEEAVRKGYYFKTSRSKFDTLAIFLLFWLFYLVFVKFCHAKQLF